MASPSMAAQLTEAELKLLQALVYQECGMHFDDRRTHFLQDRLQRRLRECHLDSFYSYYRLLISKEGKAELAQLLENLTVNETSFFRNKAQLELFHKHTLEELIRRKQAQREYSIRIWSAGCSTGQEPYTLAMLVADSLAYLSLRNPLHCSGAFAQTAGSSTLESRNHSQRHQLRSVADSTGRTVLRDPDGERRLQLPPALLR